MAGEMVKVKRKILEACMTCYLCKKIVREATTISECLHTFCRKCISEKLSDEGADCCPQCSIDLGSMPMVKLRPDHNLQDIRGKIFPLESRKIWAPEVVQSVMLPMKRKKRSLSSLLVSASKVPMKTGLPERRSKASLRKAAALGRCSFPAEESKKKKDPSKDHATSLWSLDSLEDRAASSILWNQLSLDSPAHQDSDVLPDHRAEIARLKDSYEAKRAELIHWKGRAAEFEQGPQSAESPRTTPFIITAPPTDESDPLEKNDCGQYIKEMIEEIVSDPALLAPGDVDLEAKQAKNLVRMIQHPLIQNEAREYTGRNLTDQMCVVCVHLVNLICGAADVLRGLAAERGNLWDLEQRTKKEKSVLRTKLLEFNKLQNEHSQLLKETTKLSMEMEDLRAENSRLKIGLESLKKREAELEHELELLKKEKSELKDRLQTTKADLERSCQLTVPRCVHEQAIRDAGKRGQEGVLQEFTRKTKDLVRIACERDYNQAKERVSALFPDIDLSSLIFENEKWPNASPST